MKKSTIIWIVVGVVLLILCGTGCSKYNGMVTARNNVENAWSDLQSEYQTRNDLIPGLVETVKGASAHEANTLQAVTDARTKVQSMANINLEDMDDATLSKYLDAQSELTGAMRTTINAVAEAYPQITATENFKKLQDQIEGCYRRVNTERKDFNQAVKDYNNTIETFPSNIFASIFGFQRKPSYQAPAGAEQAPEIKF